MRTKKRSITIILIALLFVVVQFAVVLPGTALANDEVIINFGSAGTWVLYDGTDWSKLHSGTPESVVSGDLDGSGQDEAIMDFGGSGVWIRMNDSSWTKLHPSNPETITTGDMDGNGQDDAIIDFGNSGVWVRMNNSSWMKLHPTNPDTISTGDVDGNGLDEVIIDFGKSGIWIWQNNTSWSKLHPSNPEAMVTGNMDGNLKEDLIIDFGAAGIWVWKNNRSWERLHNLGAEVIETGDLDGNGKDDVIFDFGFGKGIWARLNDTTWQKIHALTSELIDIGDVDGNGKDDVMIDFGATHGLWVRYDSAKWKQLHKLSPETEVCGDMNGSNYRTYMVSGNASIPGYDQPGRLWLVVLGTDWRVYAAGPSDASGNFSIEAKVPALAERVQVYAVMPDNPEYHIRGYVDLDSGSIPAASYVSSSENEQGDPSVIPYVILDSRSHSEVLVSEASGHAPGEFSTEELADIENIDDALVNQPNPPQLCSAEKIPDIDNIQAELVRNNLGLGARTIFDSFVLPDSDDNLLYDVAVAQEFVTDNVYSLNQLEDHFAWDTIPVIRPIKGVIASKHLISSLNLPSDQITTTSRGKLEAAAGIVMDIGYGNCQEHALASAYMASRFPQFKQVAVVSTETWYTWLTGSGHAFAVACEKDESVWNIDDLIKAQNEQRLISTKLYEADCIIIDSWKPGTGLTERLTIDKVVDLRWDSTTVFDQVMKIDLSGSENGVLSNNYQSESVEVMSLVDQQALSPVKASSSPDTCSVDPEPGAYSCESCLPDAEIAATVCKPFSIPTECPEDPGFNQISLSLRLLQHLRDFSPSTGYVYDYDSTQSLGTGNIPGSISGNTFHGSYSRIGVGGGLTHTGTVNGTLRDCSRVIESITWNETTEWINGYIETISFSGTNIERYGRYPVMYEYGVTGEETCLHVSSFDFSFTSTPDARNTTLLGYECYNGGSDLYVDFMID